MKEQHRKFIDEYLIDFNASRAARAAGYSPKACRVTGHRLLTNANIAAEIKERTEMTPTEVRARLADIGRGDIADLIDVNGENISFRLVEVDETGTARPNPKTKLIKRVTRRTSRTVSAKGNETENTSIEIELYPADHALIKIGEMHGLFKERLVHENPDGTKLEPQTKVVNIYIPHNGRERTTPIGN